MNGQALTDKSHAFFVDHAIIVDSRSWYVHKIVAAKKYIYVYLKSF